MQVWLRLGRARLSGRSAFDFVYFQEFPNERSMDSDQEARLDLPLARVAPYVSARWVRARQRFGFEIDERTSSARRCRRSRAWTCGWGIGRASTYRGRRSRLRFEEQEGDRQDPSSHSSTTYTSQADRPDVPSATDAADVLLRRRRGPSRSIRYTTGARQ